MRLNKYLASIGIDSRRKVDLLIAQGAVTVNGRLADLGAKIDPAKDEVKVNGKKVGEGGQKIYIALNKPKGYTSTVAKIKGEKNILELVQSSARLYPVGRLDKDSTGLIILTNDGEFTNRLTHPKNQISKKYEVKVLGAVTGEQIRKIKTGIKLEEGTTKPTDVRIIAKSLPRHSTLEITLYEGKKRQIRRMLAELHLHILDLKRTSIGSLKLGSLPLGKTRNLTTEEISQLVK